MFVAVVSPLVFRAGGERGPFDPDQPIVGWIRLAAVAGVVVCIAARRPASDAAQPSMINRGAVGPFVGGLLMVTIGGFVALDAPSQAVLAALVLAAVGALAVRLFAPPLSTPVRRLLVSPFVIVAAGIYWTVIAAVTGVHGFTITPTQALRDPRAAELVLGVLILFSAVYYAMLIYAPRQVAEREGGAVEWLIRYAAFVVSIFLGIGWLGVLGT